MTSSHNLEAIIHAYKRRSLPGLEAHLSSYKELSFDAALLHAAMAERFNETKRRWNRHDHQRRLKRASLETAYECLKKAPLSKCKSFHDLFLAVEKSIGGISGIGELMIYDTSLRIGANLRLQPDRVYLHSGTRKGARRLGLRTDPAWIDREQLPDVLSSLSPCQVEDLLCIYKDHLAKGTR